MIKRKNRDWEVKRFKSREEKKIRKIVENVNN